MKQAPAYILFLTLLVSSKSLIAQNLETARGNQAYRDSSFAEALERFDSALEKDSDHKEARFNRANAMLRKAAKLAGEAAKLEDDSLRQSQMERAKSLQEQAADEYDRIARMSADEGDRNRAHFNQGNAHLLGGELDKGIEAYKNALRINPEDEEARYNLAYAQRLKQEQEQEQEGQDQQDQQDKQDQDQNQEQDQDQQEQDQENQQEQQDQQDGQDQNQEQRPDQLSPEEAEQLLEAMMQREKELQEEVNRKRHKATRINVEKDW